MSDVIKLRKYDGASRAPRTAGWVAPSTDANAAIGHSTVLRDRARDLVRNNPHANKIISLLTQSTVGYGIRASIKSKNKRRAQVVAALFNSWSQDRSQIDAAGRLDLYGVQQQVMRSVFESGECLVRMRMRPGQTVPIALQVIESDYIADLGIVAPLPSGGYTQFGIEFDEFGRRVNYRLWKHHPGTSMMGSRYEWFTVPADQILHIFRADRPQQERGVSALAPVIIRLRELEIFQDAFLKRQQIANLFAAFIKKAPDPAGLAAAMEYELPSLEPGTVWNLPDDSDGIIFSQPPEAAGYSEYVSANLRDIATGAGVMYEALTGDYSQSNFSASRMAAVVVAQNIENWQYQTAIPQLCDPIFQWFLSAMGTRGFDAGDSYAEWTPPAVTTIADPVKEYEALASAVRGGFMTWQEAVKSLGYDPETQLDRIEQFQSDIKARGITLDFDSKLAKQGTAPGMASNGQNGN